MTKPTTHTFGEFIIQLGDGAGSETFATPCGLTTKGFSQTANAQETTVPDCDDPDAPAYIERAVDTLSAEISGSGVMASESFDVWQAWFDSGASKHCRVYPKGAAGGYYSGSFILTKLDNAVQRGQKVNLDVTMASDGQYIWNAGP